MLFNQFIQNLSPSGKKILVDGTSLCSTTPFINLLIKKGIKYTIINSTMELVRAVNTSASLIIADQSEKSFSIPESIRNSWQTVIVDYNSLPFNIDYSLYKSLSQDELLEILEYSSQFPAQLINHKNIEAILKNSLKNRLTRKNTSLEQIFAEFIKQTESLTYNDILKIGIFWGEYVYNCCRLSKNPDQTLLHRIDSVILTFVLDSGLKDLPYEAVSDFKSVERICGYIKYLGFAKNALLCLDGMGWAEWFILKTYLKEAFDISFKEKPIFSMIPSTTAISRSAIFSGRITEIYQTKYPNENKMFKENFHQAKLFKNNDQITNDSVLGYTTIAKIYNLFDETAHKTIINANCLSKDTYFKIVEQYLHQTKIITEIKILLNNNFKVFICSDHGCTIAKGNGHKIEKYLIDSYSKRGTIIKDNSVFNNNNYIRYQVPVKGKPNVILASPGKMFDRLNTYSLTHGGTGIEEIVIPFVEIKENN